MFIIYNGFYPLYETAFLAQSGGYPSKKDNAGFSSGAAFDMEGKREKKAPPGCGLLNGQHGGRRDIIEKQSNDNR